MDQAAEQLLKQFAQVCRTGTLHSEDWQRLYAFTLHVHRRHLNTHHRTVRDYLIMQGCSLQKASWVSGQYLRFAELLGFYDRQRGKCRSPQAE